MKKLSLLLVCFLFAAMSFAQYPNLIVNYGFEEDVDGTWSLGLSSDAEATYGILGEIPAWTDIPKNRMQIKVTKVPDGNRFESVYLAYDKSIVLHAGDQLEISYYCRTTTADGQLLPTLEKINEGEEETFLLGVQDITTAFNGMKTINYTVSQSGKYQLRFCVGAAVEEYVLDNITLKVTDYVSEGAPVIHSFTVQNQILADDGTSKIVGRADATDAEGDDISYEFNLIYGSGSIELLDDKSFVYTKDTWGSIVFKVTVADEHGNIRSQIVTYEVNDYEVSELYFNEDVWALVREENGYTNHASFGFPENNPDLPNVLLFGTSISIGYTPYVREQLEGIANVYRIPDNGGSTLDMLENYELWLGGTHWDVIHFNWGLHDLKYLLNNALNLNGEQVVSVEEYATNLESIIGILEPAADHLIFATTSYVPDGVAGRIRGEEETYNAKSVEVMANHPNIVIDDQWTLTANNLSEQKTNDVHFTAAGCERQGIQVADYIKQALQEEEEPIITSLQEVSNTTSSFRIDDQQVLINQVKGTIARLTIYDINGSVQKTVVNPQSEISLSGISDGLIFVVAQLQNGETRTQKLMKR